MKKQPQKRPRKPKQKGIECVFYATDIEYTSNIKLKCLCGRVLIDRNSACDANDSAELECLELDWDDEIIFCANCGREYEIQGGRARLISK